MQNPKNIVGITVVIGVAVWVATKSIVMGICTSIIYVLFHFFMAAKKSENE
jgi:hypothetical protein